MDIGGVKRHHHHLAKGERALDQDQLKTLRNFIFVTYYLLHKKSLSNCLVNKGFY